jgi:hypothetical protein
MESIIVFCDGFMAARTEHQNYQGTEIYRKNNYRLCVVWIASQNSTLYVCKYTQMISSRFSPSLKYSVC